MTAYIQPWVELLRGVSAPSSEVGASNIPGAVHCTGSGGTGVDTIIA